MYQSWLARLWSSNWQPQNQWLKKSGTLSHCMPIPGWLALCCPDTWPVRTCVTCSLAGHCSKGRGTFPPRSEAQCLHSHYTSTQVTGHSCVKGAGAHNLLCLRRRRTRNTGELQPSRGHLDFFRIPLKDIFRAPSQYTSTCLKTQRENACCCPMFSCSNRPYFFPKLFFAVSCKTFPRGVTVIEILTLPGDSRRTKCSLGGVHSRIHLLAP